MYVTVKPGRKSTKGKLLQHERKRKMYGVEGREVKFSTKEKTNQTREGSCHQTSCVVEKLSRRPHNENLLGLVKKFLHA